MGCSDDIFCGRGSAGRVPAPFAARRGRMAKSERQVNGLFEGLLAEAFS